MLDKNEIEEIRKDFPYLQVKEGNIYFDNSTTSQKPIQVIEAVENYYKYENGNPNRGPIILQKKQPRSMKRPGTRWQNL